MNSTIVRPGPARIALVLLAVVPAVMAYPFSTVRERWVLAVGVLVAVLLLGWWRGLHFTTIARRRWAMSRGRAGAATNQPATAATATAALRIAPGVAGNDVPLELIASYLNRYGLRADAVRITTRRSAADAPETWVGLTYSAAPNLAALQARSPSIPLQQTVNVAVRRLADHLRELGWDTAPAGADEIPALIGPDGQQSWFSVSDGAGAHVAAYRVAVDAALADTLNRIRDAKAVESWTALEFADGGAGRTVAAACALRTTSAPDGTAPLAGLSAQQGEQLAVLTGLHPLSGMRLHGHTAAPADDIAGLRWPAAAVAAAR